jgi:riboflavin biosynthesis pyrimidine reductase
MRELAHIHFDTEEIKIRPLYRNEEALKKIQALSPDSPPQKARDVYGDLYFPPAPARRPYTFASIVLSSDGKMAYPDDPKGPLIAGTNKLDTAGGLADFWVLNMLRSYADGVICGAKTLQAEPDSTAHIFCEDLARERLGQMKKPAAHPVNVVVSLDGADIPLDHKIFKSPALYSMIATGKTGGAFLDKTLGLEHTIFGPGPIDPDALRRCLQAEPKVLPIVITGRESAPDSEELFLLLRTMGIERLCIESPSYIWHLLRNKSLDEIFINYSMVFAGGSVALGAADPFTSTSHPHSELLMLGIHQGHFIFTRQRLRWDCE